MITDERLRRLSDTDFSALRWEQRAMAAELLALRGLAECTNVWRALSANDRDDVLEELRDIDAPHYYRVVIKLLEVAAGRALGAKASVKKSEHNYVAHEREGWSVCTRCGMVRNYDRPTTECRGMVGNIAVREAVSGNRARVLLSNILYALENADAPHLDDVRDTDLGSVVNAPAAIRAMAAELLALRSLRDSIAAYEDAVEIRRALSDWDHADVYRCLADAIEMARATRVER